MIHGLCPKDLYYRLKDQSEADIGISEYVLVKVFDLVHPIHSEN